MIPLRLPDRYIRPELAERIALIASSFERFLGRSLVTGGDDIVEHLWRAPAAIVAHGTEADPIFFFANRYALDAFESDVERFTRMPSRLSAEAPQRGKRQALLDRVAREGFIDDYSGTRITATGKRFCIENAVVWNLIDARGVRHGQAATFVL